MEELNEANYDTLEWLPQNAPYVEVDPEKIKLIKTPTEFYEKLLCLIREAKERIIISTLYFGNGSYEKALVDELEKALAINPSLKMNILVDCLRGTRGTTENNSVVLLKRYGCIVPFLYRNFKRLTPRASVYLFHTPCLRGLKKMVLPEKVNEVIGLQHMKLLVFDNHIIFTGANLSDIYFTNRLDRYIVIENCPQLANFIDSLVEAVGSCSFMLNTQGTTSLAKRCDIHPFKGSHEAYKSMMYDRVMSTLNAFSKECDLGNRFSTGTRIYPLLQMGIVSINQEFKFLKKLLSIQNHQLSLTISSGYFNFTDTYIDLISNQNCFEMDVIYASPQANGFYQASGLFGFIPLMYVHISHLFYKIMGSTIRMFEYNRPGWTYHAKGLWIDSKQSSLSATIIGSSNFGHRSVHRDLEAQFLITTCSEKLKRGLQEERSRILDYTTKVDAATFLQRDHFVPFWIRLISRANAINVYVGRFIVDTFIYRHSSLNMVLLQGLIFGRALMELLARKGPTPTATAIRLSHRNRAQRKNGMHCGFKHTVNPYERKELLQRLGSCSVRHLSSGTAAASSPKSLNEFLKDEVWIPVYRFRGIHYSVMATKVKLALTISSVSLIPYKYWQYLDDTVSIDHFISISAFASFTTLAFIFFCRFFNGLIGVISMNETNEYIRVGYLSFWGTRCNKYMKVDDVIPLNELSTGINNKVIRLRQYSSNGMLRLSLFNAELLDKERATILFGDINVFSSAKKTE
ncbi:Phospholipase D. Active site motif family protein [Brugia malayi]|uniref:CDP-diacylglycerol--glycerol-3-phosphate 3-phosphatidyltransferase n=1 Tax=Brugia malayi TaxID=6279 RepID=A0A4E9FUB6_BRUMA|nr:Phospholipase D. Active site motif family protein [Brugia malayi]VIO98050.1 Phospholipase D. Active site motif family protein [Brugia malayi]